MVDGVEAVDRRYATELEAQQKRAVVCASVADVLSHQHKVRPTSTKIHSDSHSDFKNTAFILVNLGNKISADRLNLTIKFNCVLSFVYRWRFYPNKLMRKS